MNRLSLILAFSSLLIMGCQDGSGQTVATTPSTVTGAVSNINSQLSATVPNTSSVAATSLSLETAMTTEWTTTGNTYSLGGDFGASPRDFVRLQGNNTAQSSLMYRLKQIVDNICLFTLGLPSTDGIPDLTSSPSTVTLTAELKAQMSSQCGVALDQLPADDTVVGFQVETVPNSSGNLYDRKVSFDMMGGTSFTDFFYFKLNSGINRVLYIEDGSNDSIALFEYNGSSNRFYFEFSEAAHFTAHFRGMLNGSSGKGRFIAQVSSNNDTSTAVVTVREGIGEQIHVSYSFDDDANTNDFSDGSACINANNFSIATDNVTTCAPSVNGALVSQYTSPLSSITSNYILSQGASTSIQFSSLETILTASPAN